jgi:hypothetical protein
MATLDGAMDRLEGATAAILGLRGRLETGEPWPLADVYGAEPEASWGPREVLAHVVEMVPFWLGEMERVLEGAAAGREPVPFGRTATDQTRIGIIGRDRTLPLRELFARLRSDTARMSERARELSETDVARRGVHPRLGEMTVGEVLDRFVVTHMEEHVEQLGSILSGAGH